MHREAFQRVEHCWRQVGLAGALCPTDQQAGLLQGAERSAVAAGGGPVQVSVCRQWSGDASNMSRLSHMFALEKTSLELPLGLSKTTEDTGQHWPWKDATAHRSHQCATTVLFFTKAVLRGAAIRWLVRSACLLTRVLISIVCLRGSAESPVTSKPRARPYLSGQPLQSWSQA